MAIKAAQGGIYVALTAALDTPVYDAVPDGATLPYVVIGEFTAIPWSTQGRVGREVTVTLHIWSDSPGNLEVQEIEREITAALEKKALILDGWVHVATLFEYFQQFADTGGDNTDVAIQHGILRYRVFVEKES